MERVLLFCGGNLGEWALKEIREGDLLVGADRGAWFLVQHGLQPDCALGDFDSVTPSELALLRERCPELAACDPVDKDLTDTELAFNWALSRHPREIVLLGAVGTRFDHSLANIHLLLKGLHLGVGCTIIDERNRIRVTDHYLEVTPSGFAVVSLLPLSLEVTGVTLEGFQYPLERATLTLGQSLGISNVLTADVGRITLETGYLLVIEARD